MKHPRIEIRLDAYDHYKDDLGVIHSYCYIRCGSILANYWLMRVDGCLTLHQQVNTHYLFITKLNEYAVKHSLNLERIR